MDSTPTFAKKRLSDMVYTWITYRQKGVQTLALLWALLCGSALYPFKIWLAKLLREWLDQLDRTNRSLCFGCLMLPMQLTLLLYHRFIELMSNNLVLFVLFHFRYQIVHQVRLLIARLLPMMLSLPMASNGQIAAIILAIVVIIIHAVIAMCSAPEHRSLLRSMPSAVLITFIYLLHYHLGIFGQLTLLFIVSMFTIGLIATGYNIIHGSAMEQPLDGIVELFRDNVRSKVEKSVTWIRNKYLQSTDHIDGDKRNVGQLFIIRLFTISAFTVAEHMNASNLVLAIVLVHLVLQRMLALLVSDQISIRIEQWLKSTMDAMADKFRSDVLFRMLAHFFTQGDRLIKVGLSNSLDLLTSISLFMIVGLMVTFSTVFVSIKLVRTQASSYLPMVKSIVSVSYAFVFVILDSSTMLMSFVFNF
ncbi:hypothetical protein BLA29_003413, partial [Euroglyphus maynei]